MWKKRTEVNDLRGRKSVAPSEKREGKRPFCLPFATSVSDAKRSKIEKETPLRPTRQGKWGDATRGFGDKHRALPEEDRGMLADFTRRKSPRNVPKSTTILSLFALKTGRHPKHEIVSHAASRRYEIARKHRIFSLDADWPVSRDSQSPCGIHDASKNAALLSLCQNGPKRDWQYSSCLFHYSR